MVDVKINCSFTMKKQIGLSVLVAGTSITFTRSIAKNCLGGKWGRDDGSS